MRKRFIIKKKQINGFLAKIVNANEKKNDFLQIKDNLEVETPQNVETVQNNENTENNNQNNIDNMETKEKIAMANVILGDAEANNAVKKMRKEKGLIERTESSKIILTEDNRELLND